jgi:hypothetical protein
VGAMKDLWIEIDQEMRNVSDWLAGAVETQDPDEMKSAIREGIVHLHIALATFERAGS